MGQIPVMSEGPLANEPPSADAVTLVIGLAEVDPIGTGAAGCEDCSGADLNNVCIKAFTTGADASALSDAVGQMGDTIAPKIQLTQIGHLVNNRRDGLQSLAT